MVILIKKNKMVKKIIAVFFVTLIFQAGLVIPKMKSTFSPHMFPPEEFWLCYNSSHLVAQRGGLLLAAGSLKRIEGSSKNISSIKRGICFHGSLKGDFDLPWSKYPALLSKSLFPSPVLEIHPFLLVDSILPTKIYLTPPDHPT